ncbi:hypothetical protein OROGR_023444 [Orobanche gracilis]
MNATLQRVDELREYMVHEAVQTTPEELTALRRCLSNIGNGRRSPECGGGDTERDRRHGEGGAAEDGGRRRRSAHSVRRFLEKARRRRRRSESHEVDPGFHPGLLSR